MRIRWLLLVFGAVAFVASPAFARSWPKWLPAHVSELRLRTGAPNPQTRTITDPREIEQVLGALRRAQPVHKVGWRQRIFGDKEAQKPRQWNASIDVSGQKPEAGSWLVNLDTGEITFLDPLAQSIYRFTDSDLRMIRSRFQRGGGITF